MNRSPRNVQAPVSATRKPREVFWDSPDARERLRAESDGFRVFRAFLAAPGFFARDRDREGAWAMGAYLERSATKVKVQRASASTLLRSAAGTRACERQRARGTRGPRWMG